MKKKAWKFGLVLAVLVALLALGTVAASAVTHSGTCGDNLTWSFNNITGELKIEGTGAMKDYISDEVYGSTAPWTLMCHSIKTIDIADGVTSIGDFAFEYCYALGSITFGENSQLTSIGDGAFEHCYALGSITFGENSQLTSIGNLAFSGCNGLTSITFGDNSQLTSIGWGAFVSAGLTSIAIPDGVTSIGWGAFTGCDNLTSMTVEDGNTVYHSAGNCVIKTKTKTLIAGCQNSVIPTDGSVTSIEDNAFDSCHNLTSITIPDGVTSIGGQAFSSCRALASITFGDNSQLTSIGENAFSWCDSLTSITIPDSVTSIGYSAFYNCSSLTSITVMSPTTVIYDAAETIPDTATIYGYAGSTAQAYAEKYDRTFVALDEEEDEPYTVGLEFTLNADGVSYSVTNYEEDYSFPATKVVIPRKYNGLPVTSIGDSAFSGCYDLTSITIPDSVTSIGGGAFLGCQDLTSITIPDSVTSIGNGAFAYCSILTSITIPNSVTSIGNGAFEYCSSLTSITIGDSVTSIGNSAFECCSSLTSITIPDSVTSIGDYAFYFCPNLTSITFLSPQTTIEDDYGVAIPVSTVIYGYIGSTAQAYAEEFGRTFVVLEDPYTEGLIFTPNAEETEYSVTGYTGLSAEIVIPRTYRLNPVTFIQKGALVITQPDGVLSSTNNGATVLPEDAFNDDVVVKRVALLSKTIVIEDSAETIPATAVICGYVGSTAQAYAEKYGREFIILPEIASANIALGSDITVNYLVYLDDSQKDAVMKFTVNGETTTVTGVATATPNRYQFSYTGINPQMMGDNIAVKLVLDGEKLAEIDEYSVKQYCVNMKARVANKTITGFSDAQYAALDTLLADILEYGAATQTYVGYNVDALVNEGITGASTFVPLNDEHRMPAFDATTVPGYSVSAAQVELSNVIRLYFGFTAADISRVTVKIGELVYDQDDFTAKTVTDGFGMSSTVYELRSEPIYADQMETSFTVVLLVDGVECQRMQYSVVNYIYNMQSNTTNPNLVELLKRIRNYGLSAVAYRDAK